MKDSKFYRFMRPIVKAFTNIFLRPKYEGLENIPKDGGYVFAGNHTHIMDPLLLISSNKRSVHFLAKIELWKFPKNIIFDNLGLIPVNRQKGDKKALDSAIKCLENGSIIGIFPEGTTIKDENVTLLPFKFGAASLAHKTNSIIVPVGVTGTYKFRSKDLIVRIGKPFKIEETVEKTNDKLYKEIKSLMKQNLK